MSRNEDKLKNSVSLDAIRRIAKSVVANAINGDFPVDPVIGTELSKTFSTVNSVVKRHGLLLQRTLGDALSASGRFDVMTDVPVPVTAAAHELLTSKNSVRDLAKIQLKSDSNVLRMVTIDIIAIDVEAGWAGAYDMKRGNGATESRKRRPLELDLRAVRLVLPSFLSKWGHDNITDVTTGIIDFYGSSGFDDELRLTGEKLDEHFGVPVLATLETMTSELRYALHAEMKDLLAPVLKLMPRRERSTTAMDEPFIIDRAGEENRCEDPLGRIINARPTGPGPWRPRAA